MTAPEVAVATAVIACCGLIGYAYVGYPLLLWALERALRRRRVRPAAGPAALPSVSVVITAYNEEATIGRRVREFVDRITVQGLAGEVIVVSDGSTDGTDEAARRAADREGAVPVRVVSLPRNGGKAAALTAGCRAARSEVIALADARQTWAPDALTRLLENFADPRVGAVSGELVVQSAAGVMGGVGLYWRYEKWLRQREAGVHSTVGVSGAICAVRRHLFRPIPAGTVLDDVYWPLGVVMQGSRVVFDARARAFDRLPDRAGSEFRRKVRTLAGNFQLICRLPAALLPWRNPVWFFLVSHKLARLAVPWAWLTALGLSAAAGGPVYGALAAALAGVMLLGVAGLLWRPAGRSRVVSAAASLLVLNGAAWWAFWVWATGRAARSWTKTVYRAPAPRPTPAASAPLAGVGH